MFGTILHSSYISSIKTQSNTRVMTTKHLSFPIPETLENRLTEVLSTIKESDSRRQYALQLFQVINDLSDVGLNHFFVESLRNAGIGKIKLIAVENAMLVGKKAIMTIGKSIIKAMDDSQLLSIAEFLESSVIASHSNTTV